MQIYALKKCIIYFVLNENHTPVSIVSRLVVLPPTGFKTNLNSPVLIMI